MANPTDHYKLNGLDVHGTIWQTVADATARFAISLEAADLGKDVLQSDTGDVYKLIVDTGVNQASSWVNLSAAAAGGQAITVTDEGGAPLTTNLESLDFVGAAVQATNVGDGVTITVIAGTDASELVVTCLKGTVGTINIGEVVYVTGYNLGLSAVEVELADASAAGTMPGFGIARTSFTNGATGVVVASGELNDIDTSTWSVGDSLYVSETPGELIDTKPTGAALIQKIATVSRSNVSNGIIQVVGAGRSNDVPNIPENQLWLGDSSGVATPTARAGIDTDATTHAGTTTGNPHSVEGIELLDGTSADNKVLETDGAGGFTLIDTPTGAAWLEDAFTPTLGQITFILSQAPTEPVSLSLHANGVEAVVAVDYTISGTTLTWLNTEFSFETDDEVVIQYK
jgi:hypothetical protein